MPTPIKWQDELQVNPGDAAIGVQVDPRIICLANGYFLVVWTESASGVIGSGAGSNIIGQRYDTFGTRVNAPFQINSRSTIDDERDCDIAATDDGGFVIVYVDDDISQANQTAIIWERHDSNGEVVVSETIIAENVAADFLANPQVTVNQLTNQSLVTFTHNVGADTNIRAVTVSAAGVVSAEFDAAQNGTDFNGDGDVAILANGNFVSVYREADGAVTGPEARIMTSAGTVIITMNLSTEPVDAVRVTTLANGNWVAAWSETGNNGDIRYQVFSPTGAPVSTTLFAAAGSNSQHSPDVVALPDGGFVIVWDDDTAGELLARCFNASGSGDGGLFTVATGADSVPDVAVTGDGRILFTWKDGETAEIFASIWDPREGVINAADYQMGARNFMDSRTVTARPTGTTLDANNTTAATLFGMGGDDVLIGSASTHNLVGSFGNDTYFVSGVSVMVNEFSNQGYDVVAASLSYTLTAGSHVELMTTGWIEGPAAINLTGNELNQQIWGNAAGNLLSGAGGNDELFGFGGADDLRGGDGNDALFGGSGANDTLRGGLGVDTYFIDDVGDIVVELAGEGSDVLAAGLDYALGAGVSVELMTTGWIGGTATIALTGNEIGNEIWGNDGMNAMLGGNGSVTDSLLGFGGNDRLDGGAGLDLLIGGTGQDSFAFTSALDGAAADIIGDFSSADDTILLDDAIFTGLALGALNPAAFVTGATATTAAHRILYDATTGKLYFDADGNGAGAAIQFATLSGNPAISASDFTVI